MFSTIQEEAKALQVEIFAEKYYVDLYRKALVDSNMTEAGIEKCEYADRQIVEMMNLFHGDLPDAMEIRRHPFFCVCNIAEEIFNFYEEE